MSLRIRVRGCWNIWLVMGIEEAISRAIQESSGCRVVGVVGVGGGCINSAYRYDTDKGKSFFVKLNSQLAEEIFVAEALGLEALASTKTIRVPEPICYGKLPHGGGFLVLEHLDFGGSKSFSQEVLGRQLAELHLKGQEKRFGFRVDNVIGSMPQCNDWHDDWVEFFGLCRLKVQFDLIKQHYDDSEVLELGERLLSSLPQFFDGITILPSLIHGDLWSGNVAVDGEGRPVIFDPAVYYAHHEAEWGIMTMFGGFSDRCVRAYDEVYPRQAGWQERLLLYQLYHYLNHYNIFGYGYRGTCISLLKRLV